jgi:catechol 2,3-dioxygenase-like lactoylglutathione lyase family enzyme
MIQAVKLVRTHHVTLTVTDIDRSLEWYKAVLGFEKVVQYRNDAIAAHHAVLAHPGADRPTIGLRQYDTQQDARFDEHRIGLDHLAFDVGDDAMLGQWQAHLEHHGVPFAVTRLPEISITVFRDPDNIQIELCAENPSPVGSSVDSHGRLQLPSSEK